MFRRPRHGATRFRWIVVNQVGGNDQLVFDGSSFAMNAEGEVIATAASFREDLVFADIDTSARRSPCRLPRRSTKPYTKRWCLARATTSASADSRSVLIGLERRHRFLAHGGHRGRCGGARERDRRRHARAVTPPTHSVSDARAHGAEPGDSLRDLADQRSSTTISCARWTRCSRAARRT